MVRKILDRKKVNPLVPVYTGIKHSNKIQLQLFIYNQSEYTEDPDFNFEKFDGFADTNKRYWLNIHGLHDVEQIKSICNKIGIHQLAIQDIVDINQRPKSQEYENHWFFSLKSILFSDQFGFEKEQISFILGKNYLVSFQEKKADYFTHVRERIRNNVGILRERGPDYLLYLLIESILDNFCSAVNNVEDQSDKFSLIDQELDPPPSLLKTIEVQRRQVHQIKKTIIPIKDFIVKIEREEFGFVDKKHVKYFFDLKDMCLSLIDDCEQIELRLDSNTNMFFSMQGHRMNKVMKTLTVVASIFIPLTFIAGVYGMNFSYMPELAWRWGYFIILSIMFSIFGVMIYIFKKNKWFE